MPGTHPPISTPFFTGFANSALSKFLPPTPPKQATVTVTLSPLLTLPSFALAFELAPPAVPCVPCTRAAAPALQGSAEQQPCPFPLPREAAAAAEPRSLPQPGIAAQAPSDRAGRVYQPLINTRNEAGVGDGAATREVARDGAVCTEAQAPGAARLPESMTQPKTTRDTSDGVSPALPSRTPA